MKTYLVKVFNTNNKKGDNVIDLINIINDSDFDKILIGKKYYCDSEEKRIYIVGKSFEVVREIIN